MVGFGKLGHLSFNISFVFLFLSSSSGCMYPPISFAEPPCSAARSFSLSNSAATNQTLNCCKPLLNWLTAQSYTQSHNKHTTHVVALFKYTWGGWASADYTPEGRTVVSHVEGPGSDPPWPLSSSSPLSIIPLKDLLAPRSIFCRLDIND